MDKKALLLVGAYIKKSEEKLQVSVSLFRMRDYEDAVSRAYYSAFHAAQAALLTQGLSARTHHGLISLFGLHLVKPGKIDRKYGRFLSELKDDRERCDYEVYSSVRRIEAATAIREAKEFLTGIKQFLKSIS